MSLCTHSITLSKSDFPFNTKAEINEFMDYLDGAELRFEITGDMNVGKSSLIIRYTHDFFVEDDSDFEMQMEESCIKQVNVNIEGEKRSAHVFLDIYDSIEDNEKYNLWGQIEQNIQGFLLCFSVADRKSYNYISNRIQRLERILQKPKENIPIVLVGTKIDMESERTVLYSEGLELAELYNIPYYETSSKTGENVNQAISALIRMIIKEYSIYTPSKYDLCNIL